MTYYNYDFSRKLCVRHNLTFNNDLVARVDPEFNRAKMTQEQVDAMQGLWCNILIWMASPTSYSWKDRFLMALYFLGFFKSKRPHA